MILIMKRIKVFLKLFYKKFNVEKKKILIFILNFKKDSEEKKENKIEEFYELNNKILELRKEVKNSEIEYELHKKINLETI